MLRDWTASESMDSLSAGAEVLFTRLIMKADDYGSFHGNVKLIKAALFPLKDYTDAQVLGWVSECVRAKLVEGYNVDGRNFIRIINFGQRLRNMRNIFPQPADKSPQVAASFSECPPELEEKGKEVEVNKNEETTLSNAVFQFLQRKGTNTIDVTYMVRQWVKDGHTDIMNQLKSMKAVYEKQGLVFPSKIQTLTESFSDKDWVKELKDLDPERKAERVQKTINDAKYRPEPDTVGTSAPGSLS